MIKSVCDYIIGDTDLFDDMNDRFIFLTSFL